MLRHLQAALSQRWSHSNILTLPAGHCHHLPHYSAFKQLFLLLLWLTAPARVTDCKSLAAGLPPHFSPGLLTRFALREHSCLGFPTQRAEWCQSPSWMWSLMNRWQSVLCFTEHSSRRERNKKWFLLIEPTFQPNSEKVALARFGCPPAHSTCWSKQITNWVLIQTWNSTETETELQENQCKAKITSKFC